MEWNQVISRGIFCHPHEINCTRNYITLTHFNKKKKKKREERKESMEIIERTKRKEIGLKWNDTKNIANCNA